MKEKKIIIITSIIIGVLALTLGVTFAIFNFSKVSVNSKLVLGDIYMHYNEPNQGINLEGMMPTDEYSLNTSTEAISTCVEYLYNTYEERIVSRIIGNYNACYFYGEDIRMKKRLATK